MDDSYRTAGNFDHVERSYTYHRVPGHPFYVIVGLAYQDYMTEWWNEAAGALVLAGLFVLATVLSSWRAYRGWLRRSQAVRASPNRKRSFCRSTTSSWRPATKATVWPEKPTRPPPPRASSWRT